LFFTENKGQYPDEVLFQTYVQDATVYLCKNKIVNVFTQETKENQIDAWDNNRIRLNQKRLKESQQREMISIVAEFVGANPETVVTGEHQLPHKNNYFIGNDPAQWYTDVPNYQSIIYQDIYPGIDLTYYSIGGLLKYDFIVSPGADPSQIAINYQGADRIQMTPEGNLKITTRLGSIYEEHPVIYQEIDGVHQQVTGNYLLTDDIFSFVILEPYNLDYPLIIDPDLIFSTYLGGSGWDFGTDIVVGSDGCAYVTGQTSSLDFPLQNPYDGTFNGNYDAFVTKFSSQDNTLEYSTYLGGNDTDAGVGIAVDNNGSAYIAGSSHSSDFPMMNPFNDTLAGECDGLVLKLSPSGNVLEYSTYLGGSYGDFTDGADYCTGIEVDTSGCAYVAGYTFCYDFPARQHISL